MNNCQTEDGHEFQTGGPTAVEAEVLVKMSTFWGEGRGLSWTNAGVVQTRVIWRAVILNSNSHYWDLA